MTTEVGAVLSDLADAVAVRGVRVTAGWPDGFDPRTSREIFDAMIGAFFSFKQGDVDVLLCPTTCTTAFAHDDRPMNERTITTSTGERDYHDLASWITHASIAGLPALSVPAGPAADGLPVGLQIIGPRYEDDTAITFGELLADDIAGFHAPSH